MKRFLAFSLCLLLLAAAFPVSVTAAEGVWGADVQTSVTESASTGLGLAFRFWLNAEGVAVNEDGTYDNTNAEISYEGATRKLLSIGAVVTNREAQSSKETLVRENADANHSLVDIEGKTLCEVTPDGCAFAVRIIHIPDIAAAKETTLYARPYFVVDVADEEVTVYGDIVSYSYQEKWDDVNTVLPEGGTDIDGWERLFVSDAKIEKGIVTLTLYNSTTDRMPDPNSYVEYTCYDGNGEVLKVDAFRLGANALWGGTGAYYTIQLPKGTRELRLTDSHILYLPQTAGDIDGRSRLYVGEVFEQDGVVHFSIVNKTTKWMTEETNYIEYTCRDADGNVLAVKNLYIGSVRANSTHRYEIPLPEGTKELSLTKHKIEYWTEWA